MLDLVWPMECAACGRTGGGRLCGDCAVFGVHRVPLRTEHLRGALALSRYDAGPGRALRRAKYAPDRRIAVHLAEVFAAGFAPMVRSAGFDAVVPTPTTWRRQLRRGFSPAAILATRLARNTGLPLRCSLEMRPGPRQAGLTRRGRRRNLVGRIRARTATCGRVLLIDDVVTTGATADACALELLCAGAEAVWLLTLCAAGAPSPETGVQIL